MIGDGLEFADHRDYVPGDDMRFVDWSYYCRVEKLILRLFHEHSESEVVVLLDVSGSMGADEDKFRFSLRAAATLLYIAMAGLDRVGIQTFAEKLSKPYQLGRAMAGFMGALDFLAGISPSNQTNLLSSVKQFTRQAGRGETVLLISDLLDCRDELPQALALLRGRGCDVTVMHVISPSDADPREIGPAYLVTPETGEKISIDATADLLASYRAVWKRFVSSCQKTCISREAIYVGAPTQLGIEQLVLITLKRAGVIN